MTAFAVLGVTVRWTLFAAVLVATGAAAFRFLVLARMARAGVAKSGLDALQRVAARTGMLAALVGVVAATSRFPLQVAELRDETIPLLPQVQTLGLHTMWGAVFLYQLAVLAGAALAFLTARHGGKGAWRTAAIFSVLAAMSPAFSGHAIGGDRLTVLAVIADSLHVLGAGAWLGAMVVLAAGLAFSQREHATLGALAAALVSAFSPMALAAAGLVLGTGLFASWLHLGSLPELWQSRYGQVLMTKVAAAATMAAAGAWNWKRSGPALRESGVIQPMRRAVRIEIGVGALVLLATALLVSIPQPGEG